MNYELIHLVETYCVIAILVVTTICILSLVCGITTVIIDKLTKKSDKKIDKEAKGIKGKKWDIRTNNDDKKKEA